MSIPSKATTNKSYFKSDFSKLIIVSASIHIAFFCLTALKSQFFERQEMQFHDSIKVDIIALPDKIPNRKPKPKARIKKKKRIKKAKVSKKLARKKRAMAAKRALNRLEAMAAIERLNKDLRKKKKPPKKSQQEIEDTLEFKYKGGKITPGNSYKGLDKIRYDKYLAELKKHLKAHWHLPLWLADAGLKAKAVVLVGSTGHIIGKILSLSSGNDLYDKKVMDALEEASPLPKPPNRLVQQLKVDGIQVVFP